MKDQVNTKLGTPVPSRKHAVSVQLPTWQDMVALGNGDLTVINALRNGYPRSILHRHVQSLASKCNAILAASFEGKGGLSLFPDADSAEACRAYLGNSQIHGSNATPDSLVRTLFLAFEGRPNLDDDCGGQGLAPLWAVAYPESSATVAASFWRLTGVGISSRRAEAYLLEHSQIQIRPIESLPLRLQPHTHCDAPVHEQLRRRISKIMGLSIPRSSGMTCPDSSDVFLFPSGMSAIFNVHRMLLKWRHAESVVLGFPYELTLKMLQTYGPSCKFLSAGTKEDLDELELYLHQRLQDGSTNVSVQAIWCECPSNPLLWTPDLQRVRNLADKYDLAVVVDDTIGTFANVDVMDVADIVVSSLTKAFNGFADVLAGSAVFNPNSRHYHVLRTMFEASYANNLYVDDATQLELNSRTFLDRVSRMNQTAEYLVDYLRALISRASRMSSLIQSYNRWNHVIRAVHFPKGSASMENYVRQMRPATTMFKPGYGCLFTVDFQTVDIAAAFFDALELHKGPSLGADVTLAQPYVQMVLQREKEWAASHGVRETIVRISVGMEDKESLLRRLQHALTVASASVADIAVAAVL
ncbi:putative cystathionine gamma-synthase [Cercospora beticola]|uniref:Putative cystathionine gamma-synthase n=1 Tax=Cercospora beticola TaxID=122368 RepID=A0A2G5IDU5_CERBT|nr:putative cystathionine gamma-synthase [Cercospora beticola]PIB02971.1 putative cystathionine gamma-synthase [Cercospora beticola]WPB04377.1 hypothetical protein RHO25_009023 [Cercospora beticola]CAK1356797.1 unnamed protein product [Cercospora beticola]